MKSSTIILFLSVAMSSCFLFSKFRRTDFTYNEGAESFAIPIVVPKGFIKEKTEVDSSGNTILSYTYGGNTIFYVAHVVDTSLQLQPIVEEDHMPRMALETGTIIYKGVDANNLFWREVRQKDIWVGYRFVPKEWENRFDSATNYAIVQPLKKESAKLIQ